jgi:hypothetical protein
LQRMNPVSRTARCHRGRIRPCEPLRRIILAPRLQGHQHELCPVADRVTQSQHG